MKIPAMRQAECDVVCLVELWRGRLQFSVTTDLWLRQRFKSATSLSLATRVGLDLQLPTATKAILLGKLTKASSQDLNEAEARSESVHHRTPARGAFSILLTSIASEEVDKSELLPVLGPGTAQLRQLLERLRCPKTTKSTAIYDFKDARVPASPNSRFSKSSSSAKACGYSV